MKSKWLKRIFLLVGIAVLIYFIQKLGWEELLANLQKVGWWSIPILLLAVVWNICHTLAWHQILKFMGHRIPIFQLFRLKLIAEAVNMTAPSANLGGETARAYLIKSDVPLSDGLPSVIIDKTIDYIVKMLFNIIGLGVSLLVIPIHKGLLIACTGYLFILLILNGLWVNFQIKGLSGTAMKLANKIPPLRKFLESKKSQMSTLDDNLNKSYTTGVRSLVIAGFWHTCGRMLGVLEVMLLMNLLGAEMTFIEAIFFSTIVNVINGIFFLIPGQLGVSEAAQAEIAKTLGYTEDIGFGVGIVRRIRKLILMALGLFFLATYDKKEELLQSKNGRTSTNA
ncbi:MAG: hypothetical protein ACI9XO_004164 [Paraglaciecola sp.]|jgi:uncharacterized protein (TIRG00374 family)